MLAQFEVQDINLTLLSTKLSLQPKI